MEWEPKLRTRYVGTLDERAGVQIPRRHSNKAGRTVHDYENQFTKIVDDDIKIGVTMLGMEDMRVKRAPHRETASESQAGIRCERRFSRSREHNSTSTVNQCQCSSERIRRAKARAKRAKAKAKARTSRAKDKAKDVRNESSKKVKSDDRRKCFHCKHNRSCEGRVQTETERPCRGRRETCGQRSATSTRRNSDRGVTVLTPRREDTRELFVTAMPCVNNENVLASFPVSRP